MNMKLIRSFLFFVLAALVAALVGAVFAVVLAQVSPELARDLFGERVTSPRRYAAAVGMLWGLFIGVGVMGFCVLISAVTSWLRRGDKSDDAGTTCA